MTLTAHPHADFGRPLRTPTDQRRLLDQFSIAGAHYERHPEVVLPGGGFLHEISDTPVDDGIAHQRCQFHKELSVETIAGQGDHRHPQSVVDVALGHGRVAVVQIVEEVRALGDQHQELRCLLVALAALCGEGQELRIVFFHGICGLVVVGVDSRYGYL